VWAPAQLPGDNPLLPSRLADLFYFTPWGVICKRSGIVFSVGWECPEQSIFWFRLSLELTLEVSPTSFHCLGIQLLLRFPVTLAGKAGRPGFLEIFQVAPAQLYQLRRSQTARYQHEYQGVVPPALDRRVVDQPRQQPLYLGQRQGFFRTVVLFRPVQLPMQFFLHYLTPIKDTQGVFRLPDDLGQPQGRLDGMNSQALLFPSKDLQKWRISTF